MSEHEGKVYRMAAEWPHPTVFHDATLKVGDLVKVTPDGYSAAVVLSMYERRDPWGKLEVWVKVARPYARVSLAECGGVASPMLWAEVFEWTIKDAVRYEIVGRGFTS